MRQTIKDFLSEPEIPNGFSTRDRSIRNSRSRIDKLAYRDDEQQDHRRNSDVETSPPRQEVRSRIYF